MVSEVKNYQNKVADDLLLTYDCRKFANERKINMVKLLTNFRVPVTEISRFSLDANM